MTAAFQHWAQDSLLHLLLCTFEGLRVQWSRQDVILGDSFHNPSFPFQLVFLFGIVLILVLQVLCLVRWPPALAVWW